MTTALTLNQAVLPDQLTSDVPTVETPAYTRSLSRWKRVRDVYRGTDAIRDGGADYLPQFAGESDTAYEARKTISALFNGYARTIQAAVGLLCEPEPVLDEEMPEPLVQMWENADGAGTHGAVLTRRLALAAMIDGFAGLLVEYPRPNDPTLDRSRISAAGEQALATGGELDAADQQQLGLRPYFILAKVDEVLPIYEAVNGKRTLVMLIWRHAVTERDRFNLKTVTHINVYELRNGGVYYERWSEKTPGSRPTIDEGPTLMKGLTGIPWSPCAMGEELGEHEYKPTLLDLADMNLTHHRVATGILSLEELGSVPILVRIGCKPTETVHADGSKTFEYPPVYSGPGNTVEVPYMQGVSNPLYYTSPDPGVLMPSMTSLENCKAEMGAMGAAFLAPQPVQETAAAKRMDARAESASISSAARALKDCLELAFDFAGQYINADAGSITTNSEFTGEGITPEYLTVCVSAFQAGALTLEELRHVIQTGELPEDFDAADQKILNELAGQAAAREAQAALDAAERMRAGVPSTGNGNGKRTPAGAAR